MINSTMIANHIKIVRVISLQLTTAGGKPKITIIPVYLLQIGQYCKQNRLGLLFNLKNINITFNSVHFQSMYRISLIKSNRTYIQIFYKIITKIECYTEIKIKHIKNIRNFTQQKGKNIVISSSLSFCQLPNKQM